MMQINYYRGLGITLALATLFGCFLLYRAVMVVLVVLGHSREPLTSKGWSEIKSLLTESLFYHFVLAAFPVFFALFIALNLLLQINILFSSSFYVIEIQNGALALRLSAFMLSFENLKTIFTSQRETLYPPLPEIEDAYNHKSLIEPLTTQKLNLYFLIILSLLWTTLSIKLDHRIYFQVCSYLLFYIIDDWAIIRSFYNLLKGRVLLSQIRRLYLTSFAILIASTLAIYFNFSAAGSLVFLGMMSLYFNNIFSEFVDNSKLWPWLRAFIQLRAGSKR